MQTEMDIDILALLSKSFSETFRKTHTDGSVQNLYRIIFRILQRSTENYFYGKRLKDYIHKNIQRITFRD